MPVDFRPKVKFRSKEKVEELPPNITLPNGSIVSSLYKGGERKDRRFIDTDRLRESMINFASKTPFPETAGATGDLMIQGLEFFNDPETVATPGLLRPRMAGIKAPAVMPEVVAPKAVPNIAAQNVVGNREVIPAQSIESKLPTKKQATETVRKARTSNNEVISQSGNVDPHKPWLRTSNAPRIRTSDPSEGRRIMDELNNTPKRTLADWQRPPVEKMPSINIGAEEPLKEGFTRLYRGGRLDPHQSAEAIKEGTNKRLHFTADYEHAVDFAKERGEPLSYIDVPTNQVEKFRSKSLPNDADISRQPPTGEGYRNGPSVYEIPPEMGKIAKQYTGNTPQFTQNQAARYDVPLDEWENSLKGKNPRPGLMSETGALNVTLPSMPQIYVPKSGLSATDVINAPKALGASLDVSFPGRQGLWMVGRKEWYKSWAPMMKSLVSEDSYRKLQDSITNHPKFTEAVNNGLSLTDFAGVAVPKGMKTKAIGKLAQQEEQFGTRLVEQFTGGKFSPFRASNRAYSAFANNLRMSMYDNLTDKANRMAQRPGGQIADRKILAEYINSASGRGSMGLTVGGKSETLEKASELLNTVFWSPRFLASRVQLMNVPGNLIKMDKFTRQEYFRDMITAVVGGSSVQVNF